MSNLKSIFTILFFTAIISVANGQSISSILDSMLVVNSQEDDFANTAKIKGLANRLIGFYKKNISPIYASRCAFNPSCSQYAKGSFEKYNPIKALFMSFDRLTRCHPKARFYDYEYDHKHELCQDHP